MVKVFVADSIGSVIAEKAADCMELSLQKAIDERGWRHTNRFSPGYCGGMSLSSRCSSRCSARSVRAA